MAERLRVVIADDHASMRAGVRLALEQEFDLVGEAGDTAGAVAAALRERPDVCLFDIHMPGGGGIEACRQVAAQLPETKIVMLTVSRNDADLFDALQAGASGYLLKGMDPRRLPAALHGVLSGEAPIPRTLVAKLVDEFRARGRHGRIGLVRRTEHDLTSREWEVLELLEQELKTAEIARRLFISETTVRRHVSSILRKLQVPDREAAVRVARRRSVDLDLE